MTRPRLLLHIGTHKTGTTALQKFAARNRAALREIGLVYPSLGAKVGPTNPGHHHFAHALSDEASPSMTLQAARDFAAGLPGEVADGETVLLSAEPFYRHVLSYREDRDYWAARARYAAAVLEAFAPFDVHVLVTLRRLDGFAVSLYRESVLQSSYTGTLEQYLHERPETFAYLDQLGVWQDRVGRDRMIVHFYDPELRGRAGIDAFFARIGFDTSGIRDGGSGEANVSVGPEAVELKRALNAGPFTGRQNSRLRVFLERMLEAEGFAALVRRSFATAPVPFDPAGRLRQEMERVYRAYLPGAQADAAIVAERMAGWMDEIVQARAVSEEGLAQLVSLIEAAASAHFGFASEIHGSYVKPLDKAGARRESLRALGRALEYAPRKARLYDEILSRLDPGTEAAERSNVLRNASKELGADQMQRLRKKHE